MIVIMLQGDGKSCSLMIIIIICVIIICLGNLIQYFFLFYSFSCTFVLERVLLRLGPLYLKIGYFALGCFENSFRTGRDPPLFKTISPQKNLSLSLTRTAAANTLTVTIMLHTMCIAPHFFAKLAHSILRKIYILCCNLTIRKLEVMLF